MNEIDLTHLDLNLLVTFEVLMAEGNVTRAAARLGRTQSAVSHSLARLREQVGDPLMVKVGGRMSPTPFAQKLIEEVRPILRSIQRVVAPPQPFDPATSKRIFRVAILDLTPTLVPEIMAKVCPLAPGVAVEWISPGEQTMTAVADGQIDLALLRAPSTVPEGVELQSAGAPRVMTYMRKDHPAAADWGLEAWIRWPYLQVIVGDHRKTGIERAAEEKGVTRTVGASIPHFSGVPEMLARTDLIATLPLLMRDDVMERFGLCALEPPISIKPPELTFLWSFRLTNDPGSRWIRALVMETFEEIQNSVAGVGSARKSVKPRAARAWRGGLPSPYRGAKGS